MAANKFATMLHRNTNKITLILVYAVLEWTLIVLLLLNSLFSYLIIKFADYFGLKRPCLWCSRLERVFEPGKAKNSHRDLICEAHATEISQLGYCPNHRKLAESRDMCEDCSSSSACSSHEWSKKFAFFPWLKQIGLIQGGDRDHDDYDDKEVVEDGEESFECSCCGVSLKEKFYSPCILIRPSWEVLDYAQKKNLVEEAGVEAQTDDGDHISERSGSDFVTENHEEEQGTEENRGNQVVSDAEKRSGGEGEDNLLCREILADEDEQVNKVMVKEEEEKEEVVEAEEEKEEEANEEDNLEFLFGDQPGELRKVQESSNKDVPTQHLEFYIGQEDCTLIPIELIESTSNENRTQLEFKVIDQGKSGNQDLILDFDMNVITQVEQITETWLSSGETLDLLSSDKGIELAEFGESRSSFVFHGEEQDSESRQFPMVSVSQATQIPSEDDEDGESDRGQAMAEGESDLDVHQASEDESHMQSDEIDAEVSIGTEIPDQEPIDEIQTEEIQPSSHPCEREDPSSSSVNLHIDDSHVLNFEQAEEELVAFKALSVETNCREIKSHLAFFSELNDIDEEKVPDTPSSIDSLHQLHKKLLLLDRRESGTEESLDGSVVSDIEGGDGISTVEKLKSVLKAERKTLNALYAELEEERSASAVAASQTMAMINRLQEEKAAMQMEALQYQRMMEEQSEYDQEALQLLNELMMKREREKQELEKELETYRKRVQDYEAKEKMMVRRIKDRSTRSRTSSVSCSNAEDSDGLSIDLNHEAKEEDCVEGHEEISNQNTPADAVLYLEESLAGFEEERLSILDQLRVLEEKLFTLDSDEEDKHFEDIKPIEYLYKENGNGYHESLGLSNEVNGVVTNGNSKEMNGKHHHQERRIMGSKAKRLLPFFDATEEETEVVVLNGNGEGFDYVSMPNSEFERESKKLAVEEEVDHVYERLQALEADREFLKHCISSLRKGDKGLYLLQEILQHLRNLRSVELRVRNMGDGSS
ncbi:Zein-binding domain containing protein [Parasponia andersonii]|uniref:Zein-binding domain containing protein n=1 Tax=Parasponia andersonii TaxID=3476 RepID=A0A2P5CNY6_PARAD|nr:Zein-binding domain containing protein [Parasponia andersonii]